MLIILLSLNSYSKEKPTIVVYNLVVKDDVIKANKAQILSDRIRSNIAKSGKYLLVSPKEIEKYIAEYLKQKEFSKEAMCDDDSCMAGAAGALGADSRLLDYLTF